MPKFPPQPPLLVAFYKICEDAVTSFKVTPGTKDRFLAIKLEEFKAKGGGALTSDAVSEFEQQVREMRPIVNSQPLEPPIPAGIPEEILRAGEADNSSAKAGARTMASDKPRVQGKLSGSTAPPVPPPDPTRSNPFATATDAWMGKEVEALWERAFSEGKVRPAGVTLFKAETLKNIREIGRSKITLPGVEWLRGRVEEMPLVPASAFGVPEPDWRLYGELPHAPLGHIVALSRNIAPSALRQLLPGPVGKEHSRRCEIAIAALEVDDLRPSKHANRFDGDTYIRLLDFSEWATSKYNWPLPKQFPRRGQTQATAPERRTATAPTSEEPTAAGVSIRLPHTTDALEKIFAIIRDHWTNYDEKRPPKQVSIALELDKALDLKSQGETKSSRFSETLVSMIRPPKIKERDGRASGKNRK